MKQVGVMGVMVVASLLGAVGQIMLRLASRDVGLVSVRGVLSSWPLYVFGVSYGVAVVLNIWAYRVGGKVAVIYPVIALSYVFASLLAWWVFGEEVGVLVGVGMVVIVVGVVLIGVGASVG